MASGVDNVLEISLVTASGDYLTVNAHQHPDLFWALRGGGGGTFGIVTSLTYRSHPSPPAIAGFLVASQSGITANAAMTSIYTELVRRTPALTDFGWGGYTMFGPSNGTTSLTLFYITPNVSLAEANASALGAYLDFVNATAANSTAEGSDGVLTVEFSQLIPFDNWAAWYNFLFANETGQVGSNSELGSRLISRDAAEANYTTIAQTLLGLDGGSTW